MSSFKGINNIIIDSETLEMLAGWHGGQYSATYSLLSTGLHNVVSLRQIYNALTELDSIRPIRESDCCHLNALVGALDGIRTFWREHVYTA